MCTGPFSRTRTHSLLTKNFLTIRSIVQDLAVGILIGQVAGGGGGSAFARVVGVDLSLGRFAD